MRLAALVAFLFVVAFVLGLTGCQTGQSGELIGLGHTITTTGADGSVTVERIPPTAAELAAYRDFAIVTAQQIVALIEEFKDKEDEGKTPSTEDQIKLAASQAILQAINNWLTQNGGTPIVIPTQTQ
jgi:inorganic pyrophosphatase